MPHDEGPNTTTMAIAKDPSMMNNALAMPNNAMAIIDDVIHNAFDGRRI